MAARHDLCETPSDDHIAPFSDSIRRALSNRSAGWLGVCALYTTVVQPTHSGAPWLRGKRCSRRAAPGRPMAVYCSVREALFRSPGQSTRGVSQAELVAPRGRRRPAHVPPAGIRHGPAPRTHTHARAEGRTHVCVRVRRASIRECGLARGQPVNYELSLLSLRTGPG